MSKAKEFSIDEMWRVSQRNNSQWGIEGYDVPRKYLDHKKILERRQLEALKPGKYLKSNQVPTKRGHYLDTMYKSQTVEYHNPKEKQKYRPGPARYLLTKTFKDELKAKSSKPQKKVDMKTERKDNIWKIERDASLPEFWGRKRPGPAKYWARTKKEYEERRKAQIFKSKWSKDTRKNFLMEYEHLSATTPGPGQYFPRKYYPHVKMRGIKEGLMKFGYYLTGPGKPKKVVKLKPMPKDQFRHPEQVTYDTFNKIEMKQKRGKDGIQHWGFNKRFRYDPTVPKKGEKVKIEKTSGKPKKGKHFVPGPATYNIHSVWNLDPANKNQDIQKRRSKDIYRSIYYNNR